MMNITISFIEIAQNIQQVLLRKDEVKPVIRNYVRKVFSKFMRYTIEKVTADIRNDLRQFLEINF